MTDIVLHVGLHKTGSSFLQKMVFPYLDVNYVNLSGLSRMGDVLGVKLDSSRVNLISSESFSVMRNWGIDNSDHTERLRVIQSLYKLFPDAKVIICIRDKDKWLNSLYRQHCKMSFCLLSYKMFVKMFNQHYLNFEGYIEYIKSLFTYVYVCEYEHLLVNYQAFVNGICHFIGVPSVSVENKVVNKGWSDERIVLFSVLRRILVRMYLVLRRIIE